MGVLRNCFVCVIQFKQVAQKTIINFSIINDKSMPQNSSINTIYLYQHILLILPLSIVALFLRPRDTLDTLFQGRTKRKIRLETPS